jgi:predicted nucleic acid-binding protein
MIDSNVIIDTFDPKSDNYDASLKFMNKIVGKGILFLMPTHGWFEIKCNLAKIEKASRIKPPFFNGQQAMLIEFLHIDDNFINKYSKVELPFIKSKDHIFLVVAKLNSLPFITWDIQMTKIGREVNIDIYNPLEWMALNGNS